MIFSYQFSTMADVYKHFCPKSNYLLRTVNLIFGNRSAICNGAITKVDFFNIVAGGIEHLKYVKNLRALLLTNGFTKGAFEHFFNSIIKKNIKYNDEMYYLIAALYTELCMAKPKHKKYWVRLRTSYQTNNQEPYIRRFITLANNSYRLCNNQNKGKCI